MIGGRRLDFGCCGEHFNGEYMGHPIPCDVYGMKVFDEIEDIHERESIKQQIADVYDAIQQMMNSICKEHYKGPLPFNDPLRNKLFAIPLREALGASESLFENNTLQLKCIKRNVRLPLIGPEKEERALRHTDAKNCNEPGFSNTATLGFTLFDRYVLTLNTEMNTACPTLAPLDLCYLTGTVIFGL